MTGNEAAPLDPLPTTRRGFASTAQAAIYRPGISGTHTAVLVHPDVLEAAARKAMSAEAAAYIIGSAGAERTTAANRAAFGRWQL